MREKRFYILLMVIGLLLVFFAVGVVQAATPYNLTSPGSTVTINGAKFLAYDPNTSSGTGLFDTFLRVGAPKDVVEGYNSDLKGNRQFDEDNSLTWTHALLLSEVPQFNLDGIVYREFLLDINQLGTTQQWFLSLDDLELYESPYANLCGWPFDGSGGGQTGCTTNNTATLVYDMDGLEDSFVELDYRLAEGSGKPDMQVYVPNNLFNLSPNCNYGGTGCTVYVTLYTRFGGDETCLRTDLTTCPNNDGFEEWGVRVGEPTAITLQNISANNGMTSAGFVIAAVGLLAIGTGLILVLRRRQPVDL